MTKRKFRLLAKVSSNNPSAVRPVLERLVGTNGTITPSNDGFEVLANFEGQSAKDLNRMLLSEMRRAEKKTRLRAEWTFDETVEKFFDYVPKGKRKVE